MEGLRVDPKDVRAIRDAGGEVAILDVRSPAAWEEATEQVPRSIRLTLDELEGRLERLPADRRAEIVAYCT
jgi:rhodanese-related sulfurtransferase